MTEDGFDEEVTVNQDNFYMLCKHWVTFKGHKYSNVYRASSKCLIKTERTQTFRDMSDGRSERFQRRDRDKVLKIRYQINLRGECRTRYQ